jgi:cephalosporin hydroxylase
MTIHEEFQKECLAEIRIQGLDQLLSDSTRKWINKAQLLKYSYHFTWQSRPIIQYPQDIVAMQEIIWTVRPDLIIETGIAHGGSLIFSASMLALLDMAEAIEAGQSMDPAQSNRKVLGIDIDIRAHNREAIEAHPMFSRIDMIEGSSIASEVIDQVNRVAANHQRILVCLDAMHTHDHVLAELEAYAPWSTRAAIVSSSTPSSTICPLKCFLTDHGVPAITPKPPSISTLKPIPSLRSTNRSSTNS